MTIPTAAIRWARDVTRQHSRTFYRGSLLYPSRQRWAVWAVYAACRAGDDIADSGRAEAKAELVLWWRQIEAAFAGEGEGPMAWAVCEYPIPPRAFADLRDGFLMDLCGTRYQSLAELDVYCYRVAGVIGLMVAPIGGYDGGEDTLAAGVALGRAMQLTNILRDVGEDWRMGRLYLPRDLMAEHGVGEDDIAAARVTPAYRALTAELMAHARKERIRLGRGGHRAAARTGAPGRVGGGAAVQRHP